ncbi:T9SS type A sorting domain-containing protein [Namhaeicola litoreus]|uniref:T9SS type A sorting domain-containing protein n=1 Tax=Namhaeicola litoreus TaxID=1052145 RepID=A0ABW3Y0Q1_9FLAO
MIKSLLLGLFFFVFTQSYSQDLLLPQLRSSFGLNHHTNRDVSYFTHVDSDKNTLIIATTERDSTFTDILTTKLDENYNLIWKNIFSIETNLSYDIPLKSFLNSNNELYIIGRSSFNQSKRNGLIFIVKYSASGERLYEKTIGELDGSNYFDFGYMDVDLNADGSLNLVYSPLNQANFESNNFIFLKIDNQGNLVHSFTKEIIHNGIVGKIDSGIFYFLISTPSQNDSSQNAFKLYKIEESNIETSIQFDDPNFITYYNGAVLPDDVKITIDADKNCYLVCPFATSDFNTNFDKIHFSKINNNNEIVIATTTSDSDRYYLIDSFIHEEYGNVVIANNLTKNSLHFLTVDENNDWKSIVNHDNMLATGFKKNSDGSFFITTSNSNIRLFSKELNELKSFHNSNTYELVDFAKINGNSISSVGTSYQKMFPKSDFYSQTNIHAEKLSDSQIENKYFFSGKGTSRAIPQEVIIDNDNNYLVFVAEKMGPEYLAIGGVDPPLSIRVLKYDQNLNELWEVQMPKFIIGKEYFIDENNFLYVNLRDYENNENYDLFKISPSGKVDFLNNSYNAYKLFWHGSYIYISTDIFSNSTTNKKHFFIYKLDKETGNLMEETKIDSEKFFEFFAVDEDIYFYTGGGVLDRPNQINLYKNGEKLFTRDLPTNNGLSVEEIDTNGTLMFLTNNFSSYRINKLNINNFYNYYNTSSRILHAKTFKDKNIFLYVDSNNSIVLDQNLKFVSYSDDLTSYYPYLMKWGDYILFGNYFDNRIRIIDHNGKVLNDFTTQIPLHKVFVNKVDKQDNLIMAGQHGNKAYVYNEYSWYKGFIHKYGSINKVLSNEEFYFNSPDDEIIVFPNPTSDRIDVNIPNQKIVKIDVYNVTGKRLKEFTTSQIDISNLNTGIYYIKIFTKSNLILHSKVIRN